MLFFKISFILLSIHLCMSDDAEILKDIDEMDLDIANPDSEDSVGAPPDEVKQESKGDPDVVEEDETVLVLNSANFDGVIKKYPIVLVEFYAPWCGHCKQLAPEYAAASKLLREAEPPVMLAKVDATEQSELGQRFEVQGYPTLHFFKDGKNYEYEGPRDKDGIVKYMKERADPKWKPDPEAVVTLTSKDFDDVVNNEEIMMVEFYAPWCGHCKRLAPIYEKAAKMMKNQDPPVIMAKVDASHETELGERFGVTGFPTLKIFKKGRAIEYNGDRNSEYDLVQGIQNQMGDGAKEIESFKQLRAVMPEDDVMIVGFFEAADAPGAEAYKAVADEKRNDYKFGISYDKASMHAYKLKPGCVVVFAAERFFTKYEARLHIMSVDGDTKQGEIEKFVDSKLVPLVGHYHTDKVARYMTRRPLVIFFYTVNFSHDHRKATQMWRNKIAAVAKRHPDMTFCVADDEDHATLMNDFGLGDSGEDMNVGIIGNNNKKYPMEPMDEFDADDIEEFLAKFKKGKVKAHIKSARPPKKQGAVKAVVGTTFEKIVMDPKKDVLIELYAPWCGHCKNLEPIYNKLAKKLKGDKNLVIAKMDATANDAPEQYSHTGFPTIYFAPSNNKDKPLKYEGGRDIDAFEKYLKEHATVSFQNAKDEL